jgi:hypothetical protein
MAKKKKEKKEAENSVPKEKKEALIDLVEAAELPLFVIIITVELDDTIYRRQAQFLKQR